MEETGMKQHELLDQAISNLHEAQSLLIKNIFANQKANKTDDYSQDCLTEMQRLIDEGVKVDAVVTDPHIT